MSMKFRQMKWIFFQSNRTESNSWKKVPGPFFNKNGWMIPYLWNLVLWTKWSTWEYHKDLKLIDWIFPYFKDFFKFNKLFYGVLSLGQVSYQTIIPSKDSSKDIFKGLFRKNVILGDTWFVSISLLLQFWRM